MLLQFKKLSYNIFNNTNIIKNNLIGTRNSRIEYSIVNGEYKDNFTIDSMTGVIKPMQPMDFEQLAGDNGNVRPIQLTVIIIDIKFM